MGGRGQKLLTRSSGGLGVGARRVEPAIGGADVGGEPADEATDHQEQCQVESGVLWPGQR